MTPTDLRQNFLPVKSVGLHYTHFRNHLPLFMRLPGPKNPKNCQILRRVAKVGLKENIKGELQDLREDVAYLYGMESWIYGYPLVLMDVTRQVLTATPAPNSEGTAAPSN